MWVFGSSFSSELEQNSLLFQIKCFHLISCQWSQVPKPTIRIFGLFIYYYLSLSLSTMTQSKNLFYYLHVVKLLVCNSGSESTIYLKMKPLFSLNKEFKHYKSLFKNHSELLQRHTFVLVTNILLFLIVQHRFDQRPVPWKQVQNVIIMSCQMPITADSAPCVQ